MGLKYTSSGKILVGHGSSSILPRYEIRTRKQSAKSRRKRWTIWNYSTQSTEFEANTRRECVDYIQGHKDLFMLTSSHDWGMKRFCPTCEIMRPLARWRLNHDTDNSNWRKRCEDCDSKRRSKRK